ncbi:MAG TPA: hypothetical protein VHK27_07065 [Gammaproteobacteria bacterium]|nr:hypothetical protein [Gammaproteobacteria bacterium]
MTEQLQQVLSYLKACEDMAASAPDGTAKLGKHAIQECISLLDAKVVPLRPSVSVEIEKLKAEIRNNKSAEFVLNCHAEVEKSLKRFITLYNDPNQSQRLFQRLLLLSIVDAYHKGRFDQ